MISCYLRLRKNPVNDMDFVRVSVDDYNCLDEIKVLAGLISPACVILQDSGWYSNNPCVAYVR